MSERRPRIDGIDFLRGLCLLLMIVDHFSFDIMGLQDWTSNFYSVNNSLTDLSWWIFENWWFGNARLVLRLTVICIFFCISGICCSFSRNNGLRALKLGVAATVVSLVTLIGDDLFDLDVSILFGVLHCLTAATAIYAVMEFAVKDKAKYACLFIGILFFIWGLMLDFYNLQGDPKFDLTYKTVDFADFLRIAVGTRYYGADCFGILPYSGIFLIGVYGGKQLYKYKKAYLPVFAKKPFKPLCFIGKKAVWVYLFHQPVIFFITMLLGYCFGLRF